MIATISPDTVTLLKAIALIVFIAIFLGVLLRLLTGRRDHDRRMAALPLEGDRAFASPAPPWEETP